MRITYILLLLAMVLVACSNQEEGRPSDSTGKASEKEMSRSIGDKLLAAAIRDDAKQVRELVEALDTEAELNQALASVLKERH